MSATPISAEFSENGIIMSEDSVDRAGGAYCPDLAVNIYWILFLGGGRLRMCLSPPMLNAR